ncbi:glycine/D-amino acid oxidase-like deaminating enzyme [Hydrogenoanaerobacterium saccharovorans]|uniref:Glycine/D-amino acid oxidase n=1 Tax=Hydrogenoanaerobacterium saccharovorans TaxID=474960 RepID=A0A1H8DSE1_9FIRM|nr:FAD-dependent oxidoreductase [Hydrogenoanaerobacterium saccharovorans]RPF42363.1 glycine/D-amino acid oxidase-like deaminating enzyme [Hydrogenoanaerobacterium saccharovorans]SEN10085.1 Glycine/D-amino acid oxidase [Hydrogenoanaerobacterium saccharovorans]
MESVWSARCKLPKYQALNGDLKADTVVIGAGMAGILTAYFLNQQGVSTVVLEANEIASGVTKNTTAKITTQHNLIYDTLITDFGEEQAGQYAQANMQAVRQYQKIIEQRGISCHFEQRPAYVYSLDNAERIQKEVDAANRLGIKAEFTTHTDLPFGVRGAVKFPNQAQFNPLEFLKDIASDLTIYEHTMVREVKDNTVITDNGKILAKNIVVATHYPFINVPGYYFMRLHQERSYVVALENAPQLDGMYIDADEDGYSFRNYDDLLFLGGAGHRTGKNRAGGCYEHLQAAAKDFFPQATIRYQWSAQDCIPLDGVPYIGSYSATTPNLFVATGFKKWGMTSSMVAATLLADQIIGKENPNAEVFSPQRFKVNASIGNLMKDTAQAVSGLSSQLLSVPAAELEQLEKGHGGIVEYEGEKVGVYKNEQGEVFVVSTKCTHLGCQLEWNPDELTWDCPCHGSRFDYKGKLIGNPAMRDLQTE